MKKSKIKKVKRKPKTKKKKLTPYEKIDLIVINFLKEYSDEIARFSLCIIFFWFGILKVFNLSPAEPLVVEAYLQLLPWLPQWLEGFLILWGSFEVLLGLLALTPRYQRFTFFFILFHMVATMMPLFILPHLTWLDWFIPTMTGQYIIKNLALLSLWFFLFARLKPMSETHCVYGEECD